MSVMERVLRRPEFTAGQSFVVADCSVWFLPVLDEFAWDRHPEIRAFYESYYFDDAPKIQTLGTMLNFQALGQKLLMENYMLEHEHARVILDPNGVSSLFATQAILLSISRPIIHAVAYADLHGLDRFEATAFLLAMTEPKVCIGWNNHDGIMFNN